MKPVLALFAFVSVLLAAVPARAELVFFNTGRTLSVKSHRVDGDALVLVLRGGGEIVCEASIVSRFAPDEVPYPEPEAEAVPVAARPAATAGPFGEIIDRVRHEGARECLDALVWDRLEQLEDVAVGQPRHQAENSP